MSPARIQAGFSLLLIFANSACQDGSSLDSKIHRDQSSEIETHSDLTEANEPVMVGGAFLVCADDPYFDQSTTNEYFGCRIENINGDKLENFIPEADDLVAVTHNSSQKPDFTDQLGESFWHWAFIYQKDQRGSFTIQVSPRVAQITIKTSTTILDEHLGRSRQDGERSAETGLSLRQHQIFTTSLGYRPGSASEGRFDSLSGADQVCQLHAAEANLQGVFKAILSSSEIAARERIQIQGPVYLVSGGMVSTANLFWSKEHLLPISVDENGRQIQGGTIKVWSGMSEEMNRTSSANCLNWSSDSDDIEGSYALADDRGEKWIFDGEEDCDNRLHLYCISQ